jgi:hypothetical protein
MYTQFEFNGQQWTFDANPDPETAALMSSPSKFIWAYADCQNLLRPQSQVSAQTPVPQSFSLGGKSKEQGVYWGAPQILPAPTEAARHQDGFQQSHVHGPTLHAKAPGAAADPSPQVIQELWGQIEMDEVYLLAGVAFNSRTHKIVGFAGDFNDDICGLRDLFTSEGTAGKVPEEAKYVLQFAWKDLSSKSVIMGPFFDSAAPFSAEQLELLFWSAVEAFKDVGLNTMLCVLDGCQTNLSMVKRLCGTHTDDHFSGFELYNACCANIYSKHPIFFVIDPPHAIKNCRNWWLSSFEGLNVDRKPATRHLESPTGFVMWDHLRQIFQDSGQGQTSMPTVFIKLRPENLFFQNSWAKMKVKHALAVFDFSTVAALQTHADHEQFAGSAEYCFVFTSLFQSFFFNDKLVLKSLDDTHFVHVIRALQYLRTWGRYVFRNGVAHWTWPYRWLQRSPFIHEISLRGMMILLEGILAFSTYYLTVIRRPIYPETITSNDVESHFGHQRNGDSAGVTLGCYGRRVVTWAIKRGHKMKYGANNYGIGHSAMPSVLGSTHPATPASVVLSKKRK